MEAEKIYSIIEQNIMTYSQKIAFALVILVLGIWFAKIVKSVLKRAIVKYNIDETRAGFITNLVYAVILTAVIITVIGKLGFQTASFITILGAAGLAIGLALQGSLGNFAAGAMIIIFRPFKIGDFVDAGGTMGTVKDIQVFTTILFTPDNKKIIVPNSKIISDNITNFSSQEVRRVDFVFGIGYGDDIKKAKEVIEKVLKDDPRVLKDYDITIGVSELGDSSVNLVARPWVKSADYWSAFFDINEKMKEEFDKNSIMIPFPQRDIHIYQHSS